MIRVNLLPREDKQARRSGGGGGVKAGDLVVPLGIVAAAALWIAGTALSQSSRIGSLGKSIADVEAQSRSLAPQIERVNRLAQERAELDLRLGIINRLEKGRTQSVRFVDELARCVPEHLWVTSATQNDPTQLHVEGVTFSNLVISDFMSKLDRSTMFANVELEYAERGKVGDADMVKFRVTAAVTPDEPAQ
jgi:type IV pilus assembly protein PilN